MDTDSDANLKDYGINSEIKYTDAKGDTVISESTKISVQVKPESGSMLLPAVTGLIFMVAAGQVLLQKETAEGQMRWISSFLRS